MQEIKTMSDLVDWKDPEKQQPEDGKYIVALEWHWKEAFPSSMEIIGGVVESYKRDYDGKRIWQCQTEDFSGKGSYAVANEDIAAWCYEKEFRKVFPSFLAIQVQLEKEQGE
jgi:hypothetical protein